MAGSAMALPRRRDVVPPRPPPGRQPRPARRRARRRRRCCRCSCSTRRCGGRPGRRAGPTSRPRCGRSTARCGSAGAGSSVVRGDPVARWCCAATRGRRRRGCTSPPTSAPTAAGATREVEQALAEHGIELVRTGSPYAVAPGPGDQRRRRALPGLHAVLAGPGPSTAGAARSTRPTGAQLARRSTDTAEIPDAGAARRARAARGRRGRGRAGAGRTFLDRARRLRRRPRPARPRRHLADVGAPQVGRDPPAHDARRPGAAAQRRRARRTARSWPGGSSTPTCCSTGRRPRATTSGRSSRGWRTTSRATRSTPGARAAPASRRRRRDAPAAGDRLDAQPGADDRGQLPGQGPAPGVAARRAALHALAGRRRPRLQPARLAVDGRLRHRRGAVLPGLQPDQQGRKFDPDGGYVRRWVPELGPDVRRPARAGATTAAPVGYPAPIVDHAEERREALDRWEAIDDRAQLRHDQAASLATELIVAGRFRGPAVVRQRRLDRAARWPRWRPAPIRAGDRGRAAPAAAAGHRRCRSTRPTTASTRGGVDGAAVAAPRRPTHDRRSRCRRSTPRPRAPPWRRTPGSARTRSRPASRAAPAAAGRRAADLPGPGRRRGAASARDLDAAPERGEDWHDVPRRRPARPASPVTWAALDCVGRLGRRPRGAADGARPDDRPRRRAAGGRRGARGRRRRPAATTAARPSPPRRCTTPTAGSSPRAEHIWIAVDPAAFR